MAEQYLVKYRDGSKYYYKDPEMKILHREDGPAVEHANGEKEWCVNGKLHRLDGPAVEYTNGGGVYFVNGWYLFSFDEGGKITSKM